MNDPWQGLQREDDDRLPDHFFTVGIEARKAWEEGRNDDAKCIVLDYLDMVAAPEFVQVVAEMLDVKRRPRAAGRKPRNPRNWIEIGDDYLELKKSGTSYDEACEILAERYRRGKRTIQTALTFFNATNAFLKHSNRK